MTNLRELDINPETVRGYLSETSRQYRLAKRDLGDASRTGNQSWIACALRRLNFARAEMRRAKRVMKGV
jgi:hypothetical protein